MAKIAKILDDLRFVINQGSDHDIRRGGRFVVFFLGDKIVDPDSGEDLGVLEMVRGRARVVHVQERISTLESIEEETTPGKVRKIRREPQRGLLALTSGPSVEEIEEGSETRPIGLNAKIGDFVRPI